MAEAGELARPYAIAAFQQAREERAVEEWLAMLELLKLIVRDRLMAGLLASPKAKREDLADVILDVAGDRLSATGRNFVRLLAEYGRLGLLPEIVRRFNEEKARHEGVSDVRVITAYELSDAEEKLIKDAMHKRLGTEVSLSVEVDDSIIGGVIIRAGDLVVDASLRGRLAQLEQALA